MEDTLDGMDGMEHLITFPEVDPVIIEGQLDQRLAIDHEELFATIVSDQVQAT